MSHNNPYRFIRLGKNIERVDMTSRIPDLASLFLADSRSDEMRQYETILWVNILKALNVQLMYRQHVRSSVNGDDVLDFLLQNTSLSRSVSCCIAEIAGCINDLPNNDALILKPPYFQMLTILVKSSVHGFMSKYKGIFCHFPRRLRRSGSSVSACFAMTTQSVATISGMSCCGWNS